MRGNGKGFAVPLKIKGHFRNATAFDLDGATNVDIQLGDLLLAVPKTYTEGSNWCSLFNVSAAPDPANLLVVPHAIGSTGAWNHDGATNPDTGSGLAIANPPWGLEEELRELLPWLSKKLGQTQGGWQMDWLIAES